MLINFKQNYNFITRPIVHGNNTVECVTTYKLLGINISNDLKWNEHIDYISKNASKRLYSLRILKKVGVNRERILKVYLTIILTYTRIWRANGKIFLNFFKINWSQF